jgi:hypothetical protein
MKPEPVALCVQEAADDLFGVSVLPSDFRHDCTAFGGSEYVGHGDFISWSMVQGPLAQQRGKA